jgi:EpsI family protein
VREYTIKEIKQIMQNFIKNHLKTAIVMILFVITFLLLQSTSTVKSIPIKQKLSSFPETIGDWKVQNKQNLSEEVSTILGVDDYISYNYKSSTGKIVNLYISYFSALGVTGTYHSPLNCMPGGGLTIENKEVIKISKEKSINKMILHQNKQKNRAYYWYYNRGRTIYSEYMDKIFLVLDALFKGRRDGSFIRVINYSKYTQEEDEQVIDFISDVSSLLENYIPGSKL